MLCCLTRAHSEPLPGLRKAPHLGSRPLGCLRFSYEDGAALTWSANRCQSWPPKVSTGPCGSLLSRTATALGVVVISMQLPPLLPL
jgi:hypothetical protein